MSSESAATGSRRTVRIGKYEVVSHVATGGMGAVYRALDTEENREVALKVLTPEMAARPAMLERFRREGRHAVKLRHENIVAVYECNDVNGTYYIAMEYVDGIDLHDYIDRKTTLDPEESRQIMIQAARALAHAHTFNIVHRDIKPSNFLLTKKSNKIVVKLTDLGLAREAAAEEFRVTRAGTTVGTVDYISPEQARDSGAADIRSDIYSLGCTWFHMLAGHPPFPEGGLAERLYKHMEAEPPDVREFNPRASRQLVAVLGKMLAKDPADRYQDPTELLRALNEMTAVAKTPKRETVADVDLVTTPDTTVPARKPTTLIRKARDSGGPKKKSGGAAEQERAAARRAAERRRLQYYLGAIAGSVLLLVGVGLAIYFHRSKQTAQPPNAPIKDSSVSVPAEPREKPLVPVVPQPGPGPLVTRFKPLYKPHESIDYQQLRADVEKPWSTVPALPENVPVLRVSRVANVKSDNSCRSLEEAYQKAPAQGPVVIEIHDNGPLYETGHVFEGRQVVLRAGKDYRPLLVWDHDRDKSENATPTFFKVIGGSLTLENLDLVVRVPETPGRKWTLLDAIDADLTATGCTFSQAGRSADPIVLARFEGTGHRCRFTRCFARGNQLTALDLSAAAAEVLYDGCLLVGGEPTLFQVHAGKDNPATLRIVQTTLIAAQAFLNLDSAGAGIGNPALNWFGWDALLSRANRDYGGRMVTLAEGVGTEGVHWRPINCLYAGWVVLLAGPKATGQARSVQEWQNLWSIREGDDVRREMWPLRENLNVEKQSADEYRLSEKGEVSVASSLSGDKPIGCDIDALPAPREDWLRLLPPERLASAPISAPVENGPPEIPKADGQKFAGERLDLAMLNPPDVGLYLQQKLTERQKFADKVVLVLHNAGNKDYKFTPFAVPAGTSLTIYYETKGNKLLEERQPLQLEVVYSNSTPEAVLATENGALELTNLEFRLPETSSAHGPPALLKVRGNLHLHRCRLRTASEQKTPANFAALIDFYGSGEDAAEKPTNNLVISQTILISSKEGPTCVHVIGPGARLLFQQALLVAAGDGLTFDFGEKYQRKANVQCWFQNCTLAARRAAVCLNNPPNAGIPAEPIFVRSKECAFLNPFPGNHTPGLLRAKGNAFSRGLLLWQTEGDALDKRLSYVVGSSAVVLPRNALRQPQAEWKSLWGANGVRDLVMDAVWPQVTLDAERPWRMNLDRLSIPPLKTPGMKERTVGVPMTDLGIRKSRP